MRIYTRTGDDGTTGLIGGARVNKGEARMEAIGDVDELNASLGVARAAGLVSETDGLLLQVQSHLFTLGAELASESESEKGEARGVHDLSEREIDFLERAIDRMEESLEPLRNFILPAGTLGAAALHLARAVARRAERAVVRHAVNAPVRTEPRHYLNRLSDVLFVAARYENARAAAAETLWTRETTP